MKKIRIWWSFVLGGIFGLAVWFLANFAWEHHTANGNLWVGLPVILAQPVRLIVPLRCGSFEAALLPSFLALWYALIVWILAVIVRTARGNRRAARFVLMPLAVLLLVCYVATWAIGRSQVRAEIARLRSADY